MLEKKNRLEESIRESFEETAKKEEKELHADNSVSISKEMQDAVWAKIDGRIKEIDREEAYAGLSEEDRKALEIGRKVMQEYGDENRIAGISHKKKSKRLYLGLAAALVLVLALGITSVGGPERMVRFVKQAVGDREVTKVTSETDSKIIVKEDEEEAYQQVKDEFGIDPVKIAISLKSMTFEEMQIDEELQVAELYYTYEKSNIIYFINASYSKASWGVDAEDKLIETSEMEVKGNKITVNRYEIEETGEEKYSANFEYDGVEYMLIGTMGREKFEVIVKNLFF